MIIDYVLPYVNFNDKSWQCEFYKYKETIQDVDQVDISPARYRDNDNLKYVFRSIEENMQFLNKVYFLVYSKSQVPEWLNQDKVVVVTHEEFIPKEFLPTFNIMTIEMFIHNIPGLSEHFIYGNDDFYIANKCDTSNWFTTDGLPKINFIKRNFVSKFDNMCKNQYNVSINRLKPGASYDYIPLPFHISCSYVKSKMIECYCIFEEEIKNSITRFRNYNVNFNIYLFANYLYINNYYVQYNNNGLYTSYYNVNIKYLEFVLYVLKTTKVVCINDNINTKIENIEKVNQLLNKRFNKKSKFEL